MTGSGNLLTLVIVIWASARAESALLVTRNTKDFPSTEPGIRVPY